MDINQRNIRIDSALCAAVKIGALSSEEYDEACRLITAGEVARPVKSATADAFDVALNALDDYQRNWDTGLPAEYAQTERIAMECAVEAVREAMNEARAALAAPPPASTNRLTDDSVVQWQWRWKGDEEWRNSTQENCEKAAANPQCLFEVRTLYEHPAHIAPKLTDDQWEELRRIARTYNEKGFPKYAREFFARAIIAATENQP